MDQISILIVDDDLIKIASVIKVIKTSFTDILNVKQVSSVHDAIDILKIHDFHLMITDMNMPLRYGEGPDNNGGIALIRGIYKQKFKINVPMFMIVLTQYANLLQVYRGVWKVWHYDPILDDWRRNLQDLIFHISLVKSRISTKKIETVFVEGPTDKVILQNVIKKYHDTVIDKVDIETIGYGGGASWVERQIIIWAKTLNPNLSGEGYLKAVGLLDDDSAGEKAVKNINCQIVPNSAESATYSILKTSYKYSPVLKSIKRKGISFPTRIEDLASDETRRIALSQQLMKDRELSSILINPEILNLDQESICERALVERNFTDEEIRLIMHEVDEDSKRKFANLINCADKKSLLNFSYLTEDLFSKLKIDIASEMGSSLDCSQPQN